MIKRLINGAWMLLVYACVGTIISQVIMLMYVTSAWKIDSERWLQIVAAAQGIMPVENTQPQPKKEEEKFAEQASYDQILEARANKYRDLELREQELRNNLSQIQFEQGKLAEDRKHYKQVRDGFDTQLVSMRDGSAASGKDEVRRTLESLKPKQAKTLVLEMLDNKEMDDAVSLLSSMEDSKRARIFGEFKTPDELEKLSEVLRRIREGLPNGSVPENTRKKLEEMNTPQL